MIETSINDISKLAGTARVWVFQSSKSIHGEMAEEINLSLGHFLNDWAAHGRKLFAAFEIRFDRFIIIAVDEAEAKATGCSVDKLMHTIQEIDARFDLDLLNRMKVAYRKGEDIVECDVNAFAQLLQSGEANGDTMVFNNVVQSVEELHGQWETRVKDSWHANLFS